MQKMECAKYDFDGECRRRIRRRESVISELLIKIFILNTNHKLNTIPPHTQRARLGAIGTHVRDEKMHIHMSHSVEHRRRRRECVIRELLIADSDRRLRLSSSIQEYSQSKESYYIPTYI